MSKNMLEMFPTCFSCGKIFFLSQISYGLQDKNLLLVLLNFAPLFSKKISFRDAAMIAGDWSNRRGDLSLADILPKAFASKYIPFANSNKGFLSGDLAR